MTWEKFNEILSKLTEHPDQIKALANLSLGLQIAGFHPPYSVVRCPGDEAICVCWGVPTYARFTCLGFEVSVEGAVEIQAEGLEHDIARLFE